MPESYKELKNKNLYQQKKKLMKKKESPFIKVRRNLFTIDGDEFQCTLLRKTFKVETFLGKDDTSLNAETNEEDATSASVENPYSSSNSFPKLSSNLSSNSFLKLHYNVCPRAGASPIKDKKIKDKSSTGVLQKEPTTTITNFHFFLSRKKRNKEKRKHAQKLLRSVAKL